MQVAQRLYEGMDIGGETAGLITYMRTDGVQMAPEAIDAARDAIVSEFGQKYLPEKPRFYTTKAKNAQEAHEAIRPTDFKRTPASVRQYLDADQARLYELIWKRAIASQMQPAEIERTTVEIEAVNGARTAELRAVGSVIRFDGFIAAYTDQKDEDAEDEESRRLPEIRAGTLADAATIKLPKRIPYHVAMDLLLTGRWMDVAEAHRWGLVNEVLPKEKLEDRVWEIARLLASGPPLVF
ncbi:MAG: hypothetical protein E5W60_17495, partial [Mesorhizobium sp.]